MSKRAKKKKRAGQAGPGERLAAYTGRALDLSACLYLLFVMVLLPLYNKGNYDHIGSEKIRLLWDVTCPFFLLFLTPGILYLLLLLLDRYQKKGGNRHLLFRGDRKFFSVTDWFVLGYGAVVLLSFLFSDYRQEAVMGYEKWGMGLLIQLLFVTSYFCFSRFWKLRDWMLLLIFPVTAVLFILGYLNRFGLDPLGMNTVNNPQFISLAGNINWYCGYMVMPIAACSCFAWGMGEQDRRIRILLDAFLVVCFGALLLNGSDSGIWTILILFLCLLLFSVRDAERFLMYCRLLVLFAVACVITAAIRLLFPDAINYTDRVIDLFTYSALPVLLLCGALLLYWLAWYWQQGKKYPAGILTAAGWIVLGIGAAGILLLMGLIFINTRYPGSIGPLSEIGLFTFSDDWGSMRGATWKAGAMLYAELPPFKKLVGIGPDCMVYYLQRGASPQLQDYVNGIWPTSNLTNAHCEALTVLIQNGILGLAAFGGLLVTAIYRYLRRLEPGEKTACIAAACGMALLAYTAHNIFSFQQVLNGPTMFLILGVGEACLRKD